MLTGITALCGFCLKFLWDLNRWVGVSETKILDLEKRIYQLEKK